MNKFVNAVLVTAAIVIGSTCAIAGERSVMSEIRADQAMKADIDALKSSQAQQQEAINAQAQELDVVTAEVANKEDKMYSPWYVGVNGGMTFIPSSDVGAIGESISYDDGWTVGGSVGRVFNDFRFEGAFDYQQANNKRVGNIGVDGDMSVSTLMANIYYTLPVMDNFGIYIMGGVGAGKVDLSNGALDDSSTVFAGNFGAGVTYDVSENWAVDAGWKYLLTDDADIGDTSVSYSSNGAIVGVRYMF